MAEQIARLARHQLVRVLRRHLNEIAEHAIVLDLERRAAGLAIARLQRRDHAAAFVAQLSRVVQRRMHTGDDEPAIAREEPRLVRQQMIMEIVRVSCDTCGDAFGQRKTRRVDALRSGRGFQRIVEIQPVAQGARAFDAVTQRCQIARTAPAHRNALR